MIENNVLRLDDQWEVFHHSEIADLLIEKQFAPQLDSEGTISRLDWEAKQADKALVSFMIAQLSQINFDLERPLYDQLSDADFFEVLALYLQNTATTFESLQDTTISVSKAHEGTTPYEHIVNVIKELNIFEFAAQVTNEVDLQQFIIQSIINVMVHDWGKIVTAQNDTESYHAEISYLIAREFGILSRDQLAAIRFHHIFQLLDKEKVTTEQVRSLFPDEISFVMLSVLANADVASVKSYESFALAGLLDMIRCLSLEELSTTQATNMLESIQQQISRLLEYAGQSILAKKDYIESKLNFFREYVKGLEDEIEVVSTISIALIKEIIATIDAKLNLENV